MDDSLQNYPVVPFCCFSQLKTCFCQLKAAPKFDQCQEIQKIKIKITLAMLVSRRVNLRIKAIKMYHAHALCSIPPIASGSLDTDQCPDGI